MPATSEPRVGEPSPAESDGPAQGWTCPRCGHINLCYGGRCTLCHGEPPVPTGRVRESLLDDIVELLPFFAGLCCVAAERPALRARVRYLTLGQLTDARDHLAAAARILNPE